MIVLGPQGFTISSLDLEEVRLSPVDCELGQDEVVDPPTHIDEGRVLPSDRLVSLHNCPVQYI